MVVGRTTPANLGYIAAQNKPSVPMDAVIGPSVREARDAAVERVNDVAHRHVRA
jgi:hypothetical protein